MAKKSSDGKKKARVRKAVNRKLSEAFRMKVGLPVDSDAKMKNGRTFSHRNRAVSQKEKPLNKSTGQAKTRKKIISQEEKDFAAEQMSLFEREITMQRKHSSKTASRNRNGKKQTNKLELEAPTFQIKTKGIQELVDETTKQIDGLVGYGISGLQQQEFIPMKTNVQETSASCKTQNRFSLLEEEESNSTGGPKHSFCFAPATFQFAGSPLPQTPPVDHSVDPDL